MVKTLEQINQEFVDKRSAAASSFPAGFVLKDWKPSKRSVRVKRLSDIVFYIAIALILITALVFHLNPNTDFYLFSYLIENVGFVYTALGVITVTAILVSRFFAKKGNAI